jgi:hypothetical protein
MKNPKYHIGDEIIFVDYRNYGVTSVCIVKSISYINGGWFYNNGGENISERDIIRRLSKNVK